MISIAVVNLQDYIYTRAMVSISKSMSFLRLLVLWSFIREETKDAFFVDFLEKWYILSFCDVIGNNEAFYKAKHSLGSQNSCLGK